MERSTMPAKVDPAELWPDKYRVIMENERVRVLDITMEPGEISAEHSHPALVLYVLDDLSARITRADGSSEVIELEKGQAVWSDAITHIVENLSSRQLRVLNIEFKNQKEE